MPFDRYRGAIMFPLPVNYPAFQPVQTSVFFPLKLIIVINLI
ncbi:Uncharacterized protein dnl_32760 [Desulfonema limicola]|uniref:Uncharacterized protein n=1 Tax=Desulfonema limicola TaxID=45656 RepID=A0A975B8K3_9BACT|nr:Uncharacterized protein dnl_32760 [Desulfonema limicola]